MDIKIFQVDAFTYKGEMFSGNPAAVCPLHHWLDRGSMLKIAAENNLSETAFFVEKGEGFELRWFTPKVEVDLCGHATLASAHVIFNHLGFPGETIHFYTLGGDLRVSRVQDLLVLDFPARKPFPVQSFPLLDEALGGTPQEIWKARDYLVLYNSEDEIRRLQPNFAQLTRVDSPGVMVTAEGGDADFVSRFFAPREGIDEDPVTGSAHTTLIPFWSDRLNKKDLYAVQLSERKGELFCKDRGERVEISGRAATYMTGEINI